MKKLIVFLLFAGAVCAQTPFNRLRIVPNSAGTAVGEIDFAAKNNGHAIALAAPDSISADLLFRLPAADGTSGQCLTTDGSLNMSFAACGGLTAPATITGTTSSFILQLTQSGSGIGLTTNAGIQAGSAGGGLSSSSFLFGGGEIDSQHDNDAYFGAGQTVVNGVPKLNGTANGNGVGRLGIENGALNYYVANADGSTGTATFVKVFGVSRVGAVTLNSLSLTTSGGTTLLVGNTAATGNPGIAISASTSGVSPAIVATAGTSAAIQGSTSSSTCTGTPCAQVGVYGNAVGPGVGVLAQSSTGTALYVNGTSVMNAPVSIQSTLNVSSAATMNTVSASFMTTNTFQVASTVTSGNMSAFQATGAGTAIYAVSSGGLAAEFGSNVQFDASLTGTHAQNVGTGDTPTFNGLSTGSGLLSGTHIQNLGTSDTPTFLGMNFNRSGGTTLSVSNTAPTGNPGIGINTTVSGISPAIIGNNTSGGGVGIQAQATGTGIALQVNGTSTFSGNSTFNAPATINSTLTVTSASILNTVTASFMSSNTFQVASAVTSGNMSAFQTTGAGTAIYASSTAGLAAEFASAVKFDDILQGTHIQNLGTSDHPTFASISVGSCSGCAASTSYTGGTGVSIIGNQISIGQAVGPSNGVSFAVVSANALENPGWNFNNFGFGTLTASAYYAGGTQGVSGFTCSEWTAGLCTRN